MKNLKKVLALVVALTMVLGTVAFASFTDVAEDSDYATAVQTLSSLSILNGYEDGTFKPDGDITRAEFCAVVCRAKGWEGSANGAKGATQFTDVPADHWASGYINLAAGSKIVNGMGDGTFEPESNVTYEQAVKMLVVALGYEPMAAQKGGYPTGYLVVANTYGMTDGVKASDQTAAATRGIVAQLTYNALDIPVMEQTGFGSNTEYTIKDGNNDYDYKSLLTDLGVAKLEGAVVGTSVIGGDCDPDQVVYSFNEANDDPDWTEYWEKNEDDGFADYTFYVAEGVDADDFFGVATVVFVREMSKNKYEIIAIMPNDDSEIIEIGSEDLDEDETTDSQVVYYPTKDSKKTDKVKLADGYKVFANYNDVTADGFVEAVEDLYGDVEITLIENTGDSKFDMVILKAYSYGLVDYAEVNKDRFTTKGADGKTYTFDFEDEDISNKIVNKDGEAITLADFAENDVVAILSDGNKRKDFNWIEVINLGQNAVEGTVTEVDDEEVYVDGTAYEVVAEDMPKLGDEGAYFLTMTGKIFYFDLSASVSGNYGYILETALNDSGFSEVWQVKLLTKDAGIVVYDVDDKFKVTVWDDAEGKFVTESVEGDDATVAILSDLADNDDHKDAVASRLVTYKLNSSNYIKEINAVTTETVDEDEYSADAQNIDGFSLEDDVVIFNVSNSSKNSAYKTTISALVDEAKYAGLVAVNDDDEYDCFVVVKGGSKIDTASDIAVVEAVTNITTEDDEDAIKVRYYISNEDEVKELVIVADEEISEGYWGSDIADVKRGSLIMFAADEAGVASAFTVIANVNEDDNEWDVNEVATNAIVAEDDDNRFVFGGIVDYESKTAGKVIKTDDGEQLTIKASTNKYTVDNTRKTWAIDVSDWEGGEVDKAEDGVVKTAYFARIYNRVVNDFVTIGANIK